MWMKSQSLSINALAGIEYLGLHGITQACLTAITGLISNGVQIKLARLITCDNEHAFLLSDDLDRTVAIKAGFASGYG